MPKPHQQFLSFVASKPTMYRDICDCQREVRGAAWLVAACRICHKRHGRTKHQTLNLPIHIVAICLEAISSTLLWILPIGKQILFRYFFLSQSRSTGLWTQAPRLSPRNNHFDRLISTTNLLTPQATKELLSWTHPLRPFSNLLFTPPKITAAFRLSGPGLDHVSQSRLIGCQQYILSH